MRTWLSVEVELVAGRGEVFWPRPGRILVVRRTWTFRQLADAIDVAFGRWDRSHLHRFVLEDGTVVLPFSRWEERPRGAVDDTAPVSMLEGGQQFAYEFDMGDSWEHLCTVARRGVDPLEEVGYEPDGPTTVSGWGELPDQHGRRWRDDDPWDVDAGPPPEPSDPLADLPPILPGWGDRTPPSDDEQIELPLARRDWDDESVARLRGAVHRGDGAEVVGVLRRRPVLDVAHLAGDGLLIALDQRVEHAHHLARRLADELPERFEAGDEVLAAQLDAARRTGLEPAAPEVPIHLDELASFLEGDGMGPDGWRLHLPTGQIWPSEPLAMTGEDPPDDWDDEERWLTVVPIGSRDAWQDLQEFIATIEDPDLREALRQASRGRGAFRRAGDLLAEKGRLHDWHRFEEDRTRGRARQWLADRGHRAVPPALRSE